MPDLDHPPFVSVLVLALATTLVAQEPTTTPSQRMLTGEDAARAERLETQIGELEAAGSFDEVIPLYEQLLELRNRALGKDHWQTVSQKWDLQRARLIAALPSEKRTAWQEAGDEFQAALVLITRRRYADADSHLRQYRKACLDILGATHPETLSVDNYLVQTLRDQGKHAEALALAQETLVRTTQVLGSDHPTVSAIHSNLALTLDATGQHAAAFSHLQEAVRIKKSVYGPKHPNLAIGLSNLASNLYAQGRYADAQPLLEEALTIVMEAEGEKSVHTATLMYNIATNMFLQDKHEEAQPYFEKALEMTRELSGEEHVDTVFRLDGLAMNLMKLGHSIDALPVSQRALEITIALRGEDHPETAQRSNNLAVVLSSLGKHAEAVPLLQNAVQIQLKLWGEEHPYTAVAFGNLADNLMKQKKFDEAEYYYRKRLELTIQFLGEKHPETARGYNELAASLLEQGKLTEADTCFRKALELTLELHGEHHPSTATLYSHLASVLRAQAKHAEAQPLFEKSLAIRREALGDEHASIAGDYSNLATNLAAQGKFAEAQPLSEKALQLCRQFYGEKHPDTVCAYSNIAANLIVLRQFDDAEKLLVQGAVAYELARLNLANAGFERSLFAGMLSPYTLLAAVRAHRNLPELAWEAAEHDLARGLLDEIATRELDSLSQAERRQREELVSKLRQIDRHIVRLVTDNQRDETEEDALTDLRSERQSVDRELAELAMARSQREIASLSDVQAALTADAALVLWVDIVGVGQGGQEHWGCVVRQIGSPSWVRLPGTGADHAWIDEDTMLPVHLRALLQEPAADERAVRDLAKQLYTQRLEPIASCLDGVRSLYVVSTDLMRGIPVELLADQYTVSYVPSGAYLARLKQGTHREHASLLALGDPVFQHAPRETLADDSLPESGLLITTVAPNSSAAAADLQAGDVLLTYADGTLNSVEQLGAAIASATNDEQIRVKIWRDGSELTRTVAPGRLGVVVARKPAPQPIADRREIQTSLLALRGGDFSELPGTRVEVLQIAKLFGQDSKLLLDSDASEQALDELRRTGELSKYTYLHFATHGAANTLRALESSLILSQDHLTQTLPGVGGPTLNGQVSAREVLEHWALDAELVTLSACDTALGPAGGGDGMLGFTQAFLVAGSRAVCLSLWKVDDIATSLLMRRFYQNLLGQREELDSPMPKAEALAEAKRWLENLPAADATRLQDLALAGVDRGTRGQIRPLTPPVSKRSETIDKPFAHPRYWAAFILVGDPH